MQVNKVHSVHTIALVSQELGEDESWLVDLAVGMEPEDGLIWVYGPEYPDGVMAFSDFGVENLPKVVRGVKFHNGVEVIETPAHNAA